MEEWAAKLSEELRLVSEEKGRDTARGDVASQGRELSAARASLSDAEEKEKVVRELTGRCRPPPTSLC